MDVIALVDDIQQRVEPAKLLVICGHAHSGWWNAVTRQASQVVAIGNATDRLVVCGCAEGRSNPLAVNTRRVESHPTLAASDLPVCEGRPSPDPAEEDWRAYTAGQSRGL